MKNRIVLLSTFIFLAISQMSIAKENYHMKMVFESIDGSDKELHYYPVGTKFYIESKEEMLSRPIKSERSSQYFGSYKLTVYSPNSSEVSEIFNLEDRRITIFYYTLKTDGTGLPLIEDSIPTKERIDTEAFSSQKKEDNLSVYPIPARDFLTIDFAKASVENTSLSIFNLRGQEVFNRSVESGTTSLRLEVSDYISGNYVLMIRTSNELVETKRIIIE